MTDDQCKWVQAEIAKMPARQYKASKRLPAKMAKSQAFGPRLEFDRLFNHLD